MLSINNWKSWYPLLKWDTRYDMIYFLTIILRHYLLTSSMHFFDSEFKLNRAFGKLKLTVQNFDQRIYGSKNQSGTAASQCRIIISQMKDTTQKIIVSWEIMDAATVAFIKMIRRYFRTIQSFKLNDNSSLSLPWKVWIFPCYLRLIMINLMRNCFVYFRKY